MIKIQVSKTLQGKIRKGHPWVFHYQIQKQQGTGNPGDLGVVYDSKNRLLAVGLYDPFSDIRLRILQTSEPVEIDAAFFRNRLRQALVLRESIQAQGTTGYRVLNGENDGFPGLVLDRYGDTAVIKLYTLSWVSRLDTLLAMILDELKVQRCVLRLSRNVQKTAEGRTQVRDGQVLAGSAVSEPVRFRENGLHFEADVLRGHKTGFFLDQRENRQHIRGFSRGKRVLNVFSYSGAFSVYAFAGGCRSVMELESSQFAQNASRKSLKSNFPEKFFSPPDFIQIQGDAFQHLAELEANGELFDLVILDPPAFAARKNQKSAALKAYSRLVHAGAVLTSPGGMLFAASCSAHVSATDFYDSVFRGLTTAEKQGEEIMRTGHAQDHPVTFELGAYLKGIFCRIIH
ncbi:MAG: class I SAM-dependent rRNA methyltransferase [Nitrospinaceae bacterium]